MIESKGATLSISTDGINWQQIMPAAPVDWARQRHDYTPIRPGYVEVPRLAHPPHVGKRR